MDRGASGAAASRASVAAVSAQSLLSLSASAPTPPSAESAGLQVPQRHSPKRQGVARDTASAQTLLALGEGAGGAGLEPTRKRRVVAEALDHSGILSGREAELEQQQARQEVRMATESQGDGNGDESVSDSGGEEEGATTTCSARSDDDKPQKKRKRKFRKATHTIRKEEKERLQVELDELNAKMIDLQRRALNLNRESEEEQTLEEKATSRNVLSHLLRRQQLEFATIRKMITESTASALRGGCPIQQMIHLKEDLRSRRDSLLAVKASKLRSGLEFLYNRLPDLDLSAPIDEDFRFESPDGDFIASQFAIIQFEDASNVRQVFDQLNYFLSNIEISVSEKLGHLTIREDDDVDADGIVQNKIVSTTVHGVQMESNTVLFSQFYEGRDVRGCRDESADRGLIVSDFVDVDDRHPYLPSQRVRKDVNHVMELRSLRCKPPVGGADGGEQGVVLIRWVQSHLHHPQFPIARVAWLDLREKMDAWSKNMHKMIVSTPEGAPPAERPLLPVLRPPKDFHHEFTWS